MWYSMLILHLTLAFHTGASLCPTCSSFEPTQLWPLGPFGEWTNGWNAALSISPSCCSSGFQVKQIIKKKITLTGLKGAIWEPVLWCRDKATTCGVGIPCEHWFLSWFLSIFIQFPGKGSRKCSKYLGPCHAAE